MSISQGPVPQNVAGLYYPDKRAIVIDDQVQQPAVVAAILAHEIQHAADGRPRPEPGGCQAFEQRGYQAEIDEARWFSATFGPPVLTRPEDKRAWADVSIPMWWHVALSCDFDGGGRNGFSGG